MNIFVQEVGGELVKTPCTSSPPVSLPVGRHDPKRSTNTGALFAIKFPRTTVISYVLSKQNGYRRRRRAVNLIWKASVSRVNNNLVFQRRAQVENYRYYVELSYIRYN